MAKKVLLVEDDFFMKELYERTLELQGFEVNAVSDGQEAIDNYLQIQPDVVILDIMLPNVSGIEVLRYIRSQNSQTPVVMVSNLNTQESMQEASNLGATDYWVKADKTPSDIAEGVNHFLIN